MMKTANGNTRTNHLDQPTFPFVNTSLHSLLTRNIRIYRSLKPITPLKGYLLHSKAVLERIMECPKLTRNDSQMVFLAQVSREGTCNGFWLRAGAFELWTLCPTDLSQSLSCASLCLAETFTSYRQTLNTLECVALQLAILPLHRLSTLGGYKVTISISTKSALQIGVSPAPRRTLSDTQ